MNSGDIRKALLDAISEMSARDQMQQSSILATASEKLGQRLPLDAQQALLAAWYDPFRTGQLSWGYNLSNPNPPFCHLTERGRTTLQHLSQDPANPEGYLGHLKLTSNLNDVALSYITEALLTYNSNAFKATAVMIGAAAESLVLELRDELVARLLLQGKNPPADLDDWRIKRVLDGLQREFEARKKDMPKTLADDVQSYWPAFTQQIRSTRNDAGHPVTVTPVTPEAVHGALLIFPELARLAASLREWIRASYA